MAEAHTLEEILGHVDDRIGEVIESKMGAFLWKLLTGFIVTGIIAAISVGALYNRVGQNEQDISALDQSAAVFITRENVEDILGVRDNRLDNIEASLMRIEKKLDTR